ncbi:MAG TPA: folate-binding protein [Roseiarcus sp.]|nr:folate-binding protein [Roseiarcus sp.]
MANWTLLPDRSVLSVAGDDAASFLHGLVTSDVESLAAGQARFAALLTPQGKILFDFFIYRAPEEAVFLIDCPSQNAGDLAKRLGFYRLRAKVTIADLGAEKAVAVCWTDPPQAADGLVFADPREARLGFRAILPRAAAPALDQARIDQYEAHRIALGAPKGGVDFVYGDAFPHDANMDLLHGVDFDKGCYVGQEVVSRMRHRGGVRKRVVRVKLAQSAPGVGTPILAGESTIGALGSTAGGEGLALLRIDRLAEAQQAGRPLTANGVALSADSAPG